MCYCKVIYSTIYKIQNVLDVFSNVYGSQSIYDEKIVVNIQERFTMIYRLCLRNKDVFYEDFRISLTYVAYNFNYTPFSDNTVPVNVTGS